jgi:hypothetical protein
MSENVTNAIQVRKLLRQQAAIAHFGSFALRESDVLKVLTEAARVCAECLSVPFSKVCRYREKENDLLIEAGNGWHAGVVGNVISRADIPGQSREQTARSWAGATTCRTGARKRGRQLRSRHGLDYQNPRRTHGLCLLSRLARCRALDCAIAPV